MGWFLVALLFSLIATLGMQWSNRNRLRAVQDEFDKIKAEIRAERESGSETITVFHFSRS